MVNRYKDTTSRSRGGSKKTNRSWGTGAGEGQTDDEFSYMKPEDIRDPVKLQNILEEREKAAEALRKIGDLKPEVEDVIVSKFHYTE